MAENERATAEALAHLEELVTAVRKDVDRRSMPKSWLERYATPATVLIGVVGLLATTIISVRGLVASSDQFDRTIRQDQYSDIVDGLASTSVGVQVNSIRRLVQYVTDLRNFAKFDDPGAAQSDAAKNTAQTLTAFIEDESQKAGHGRLTDYRDPQPIVVSRALHELIELTGSTVERADDAESDAGWCRDCGTSIFMPPDPRPAVTHFPGLDLDLSLGNFHQGYAPDFAPTGTFIAQGADFRAATVTGWDLSQADKPDLRNAFFTCANLQTSELGTADVAGADFTGANLRGADLSGVRHLRPRQLRGAVIGEQTQLPPSLEPPDSAGWGFRQVGEAWRPTGKCKHLVEGMTNVVPASGLSPRLSCSARSRWPVRLAPVEQTALHRVCGIRAELERPHAAVVHTVRASGH